jgi:spore germination protein GerM
MQIDPDDGRILRIKTPRQIPVSDSPLRDTLEALLRGPTAEEADRGLISLIPPETRLLGSPTIRGETAYINFSENFQFNTYGAEGYTAQLRQVVWTATEFPTVTDVQILIEGRRLDYLGESIRIGSPLNKDGL